MTESEIKYKYIRYTNMGVSYAQPKAYSTHSNPVFVNINLELEKKYNKL